jgi:uncharacterized protein YutE (UPF0331/DUF86 family)
MITAKEKILLKLEEMEKYLEELGEMIPEDEEEYLSNLALKRACEKTIELAIESLLSAVSMLVSFQKLGIPQSEDNLIEFLEKGKVISPSLGKRLTQIKGFRNIIVHRYGVVDDTKTYLFLTEELGDFDFFAKEVRKFLKTKQ